MLSIHDTPASDLTMLSDLRQMPFRERIKKASQEQYAAHPELFSPPKIYIASKAVHRPRWRALRDECNYRIISTWIDTDDRYSIDPEGLDYSALWQSCIQDVKDCDVLILYAEPGEHLKGALVEIGVAFGLNKEIHLTGDVGDNGTWHNHPLVKRSDKSIEDLMAYVYGLD